MRSKSLKLPANDLIFSKVACLRLATLPKKTPLQKYFARILSTSGENGFEQHLSITPLLGKILKTL